MDRQTLWRVFGLTCLLVVLMQGQPCSARGGRGGGGRGGGSRGSRGGSRGSSGGSSSRYSASYSTTTRYFSSGGSYLRYVPGVRTTRYYTAATMATLYWTYYPRYYSYANSAIYARRGAPTTNTTSSVCANYAEAENGTYMGIFTCPLDFEPPTFTGCCGESYEEYCCQPDTSLSTGAIIGIVVGSFVGAALIWILINYICKKCKEKKKKDRNVTRSYVTRLNGQPQSTMNPGTYRSPSSTANLQMSRNPSALSTRSQVHPYPPPPGQPMPNDGQPNKVVLQPLQPGYLSSDYTTNYSMQYSPAVPPPPPYSSIGKTTE